MEDKAVSSDNDDLKNKVKDSFHSLAQEARELYLEESVQVLDSVPAPLDFFRSYVSANKPVVIRGATDHWSALEKWSSNYFREKIGTLEVTVTVTPNGYADAVNCGKFVMPEERKMTMNAFLDILDNSEETKGVFYIQKQNSNLTEEFQDIIQDVDTNLQLGLDTFGKVPDAVNFWMGDGRAVTSMHRDHYENLYCVVSGWKTFILIPPTDLPFVPYENYQAASYKETELGVFNIVDDLETGEVPWIAIDPLQPDLDKYPQYTKARPVEVTLHAGETLYLPSLWFHHVRQSHSCIAVNYWYDMDYDIKYNYYKFVEKLVELVQ